MDDAPLRKICGQVVVELMTRYGWRLLDSDEFVRRVYERAAVGEASSKTSGNKKLKRIALNEYALVLYQACNPRQRPPDDARLNQGYQELGRYLYSIASHWRPDALEDAKGATQQALEDIYLAHKGGKIKQPGAFLSFSMYQLRGAFTALDRERKIGDEMPIRWEEVLGDTDESDIVEDQKHQQADPASISTVEGKAEERQLRKALDNELRRKFQIHPRARRQLRAALLRLAFKLKSEEIAKRVSAPSPSAADALVAAGKRKLQNNKELRKLYVAWFNQRMQGDVD